MTFLTKLDEYWRTRVSTLRFGAIVAVFIAVATVISWAAWNSFVAHAAGTSSDSVVSTPSSLASLTGANVEGSIDEMVFLNDVKIQAGPTPTTFVAKDAEGNQLLVMSATEKPQALIGKTVDINGTIRRLPNQATLRNAWKLSKQQIRSLGEQRIYLSAEYIKRG